MSKKPEAAPGKVVVSADPLICREFPLGADEIVTASLWMEVKIAPVAKPERKTLVQAEIGKKTPIAIEVLATNLPGPVPATLSIEFHRKTKTWEGYLDPGNGAVSKTGEVLATFVTKSPVDPLAIDLCGDGFYGAGPVEVKISSLHCVPTILALPSETLYIDNPFDLELEYGNKKLSLTLSDAQADGGVVPETLLVGTPLQITVVKIPAFLKDRQIQFAMAVEKESGPKLINWWNVELGHALPRDNYLVGLSINHEINPVLETSFLTFDIRVAFRVLGKGEKDKPTILADLPLATEIPKPMALQFSWKEKGIVPSILTPDAAERNKNALASLRGPMTDSGAAGGANRPFQFMKPTVQKNFETMMAELSFRLGKVYPGTKINFHAYVGYSPTVGDEVSGVHYLGYLENSSVARSSVDPNAIMITGFEQDRTSKIDLGQLRPLCSVLDFRAEFIRNVFLVLSFIKKDGKGNVSDIPFRHLLNIRPNADQGVVSFSSDRIRVEQSKKPIALGIDGLTLEGKSEKIFDSEGVKYDDKYRPKLLTVIMENGWEMVPIDSTLLEFAGEVLGHSETWDPARGTNGKFRPATLNEVLAELEPFQDGLPSKGLRNQFQFAKLRVKFKIDAEVVRQFYWTRKATMREDLKTPFEELIIPRVDLILKTAESCSLNPLYVVSHIVTEFSSPSIGMKDGDKTYYNFFGVEVYHAGSEGVEEGKKAAKKRGWDSPEAGLVKGINFLGDWVYNVETGRDTLYDMKWDIKSEFRKVGTGQHFMYGTAVNWAVVTAGMMETIFKQLSEKPKIDMVVPKFKKK